MQALINEQTNKGTFSYWSWQRFLFLVLVQLICPTCSMLSCPNCLGTVQTVSSSYVGFLAAGLSSTQWTGEYKYITLIIIIYCWSVQSYLTFFQATARTLLGNLYLFCCYKNEFHHILRIDSSLDLVFSFIRF